MRSAVFAAVLLAFSISPAYAAKKGDPNTITVVQPDGKEVTIEMDDADALLPGTPEPPPAPRAAPKPAPVPVQEKPIPDVIVKPKAYRDQIVAPTEAPSQQPIAPPVKEKPAKKQKVKAKEKVKDKSKKAKAAPTPPRPPVQKDVQRDVPPGSEISERMATSIAMDAAPPSKGFTSMRQSYKGKEVYVVTFKTEEGPYDVLVDVLNGDVLVSGYVENAPAGGTPAPGHLPSDWEPYKPVPVGKPAKN